jgi:hypothetical protein
MKDKKEEKVIPSGISPVRYMMNEAFETNIEFLKGYEEARNTKGSVVILEGDWGGQIYLVCPMELIKCECEILELLLNDLDSIAWKCNDGEGKGIYYEVRSVGEGISGGMGGGNVESALWIHDEFKGKDIEDEIRKVIFGEKKRIHG